MKKYEYKLEKIQKLHGQYETKAEKALLKTDSCEMGCAAQCIKKSNDFPNMVVCLTKVCLCEMKVNATEILQKTKEKDPSFIDSKICNRSCVSEC